MEGKDCQRGRFRRVVSQLIVVTGLALSACGGSGGGDSDLAVSFTPIDTGFMLWESGSFTPHIGGLQGNTPNCSMSSGSVPPGMVLESRGCRLHGFTTTPGTWGGTMVLTVDGYKGSLSTSARFSVVGPSVVGMGYQDGDLAVPWGGAPFSLNPAVRISGGFPLRAGDQVSYTLVSTLPPGVSFDTSTGWLSGSTDLPPNARFGVAVTATVTRGNLSITTATGGVGVVVRIPGFGYDRAFDYPWAGPFRANPSSLSLPPGASVSYSLAANYFLPPGISLDPQTGIISGMAEDFTPNSSRYWGANVIRTLVTPAGEVFTASIVMWPSLVVPYFAFRIDDPAYTIQRFRFMHDQAFQTDAPLPVNALPGDTYSTFRLANSVPAWFTIDANTGALSGTPPASAMSTSSQSLDLGVTITRNGRTRNAGARALYVVN